MSKLRREVLNVFKKLHRTRQYVFQGDQRALTEGRKQINENFRKNQDVIDEDQIREMVQLAQAVDKELRTNVIQAVEKEEGLFELRITDETTRLNNTIFNPDAVLPTPNRRSSGRRNAGCCGGTDAMTAAINNIVPENK